MGGAQGRHSRVRSAEVGPDRLGRGSRGPRSARAPPPGLSHRVGRVPTPGCCAERGRDASGPWGRWQRGVLGRPAAPLGTCSDARRPARPGLHGVHPEEAARAAAAALLLQGEVSGAGRPAAGEAGPQQALARRPRPPPGSRSREWARLPGTWGRASWGRAPRARSRPAREAVGEARAAARSRSPAAQEGLGGRATASLRSRPRLGNRTSASRVLPRAVWRPTRRRLIRECGLHRLGFLFICFCMFVDGSCGRTVNVVGLRSRQSWFIPGDAGAAFNSGWICPVFTCSFYSICRLPSPRHPSDTPLSSVTSGWPGGAFRKCISHLSLRGISLSGAKDLLRLVGALCIVSMSLHRNLLKAYTVVMLQTSLLVICNNPVTSVMNRRTGEGRFVLFYLNFRFSLLLCSS